MAKRTCIRWTAAIVILWTVAGGCSGGSGSENRPAPEEAPSDEHPDETWPPPDPPVPEPEVDAGTEPMDAGTPEPKSFDVFGTRQLHPTAPGGRTWAARWDGPRRTLGAWQRDPYDPELQTRGSNQTLEIRGDGTARSSGETVRIYIGTPHTGWLNTEVTVYARRVSEWRDAPTSSGFEFQTRTNDGHQSERGRTDTGLDWHCLGHAYGASLRFDGRAVLEKELKHPHYTPQVVKELWGGRGLRRNTWIGLKVLTYNLPGDRVKQELWMDLTDGREGGTWRKVHEHIDAGGWSIPPRIAATCGIPADHRITTPQPFIILRNDKVREQWLKKLTVREIVPPTE